MSQGEFIDATMLQELEAALVQQIELKSRNSSTNLNNSTMEAHDKGYEDWQRKCE